MLYISIKQDIKKKNINKKKTKQLSAIAGGSCYWSRQLELVDFWLCACELNIGCLAHTGLPTSLDYVGSKWELAAVFYVCSVFSPWYLLLPNRSY